MTSSRSSQTLCTCRTQPTSPPSSLEVRLDIGHAFLSHSVNCAIGSDSADCLKVLMRSHSKEFNLPDGDGNTWLHHAAADCAEDCVAMLLAEKLDPCAKNKDGNTPLHLALALESPPTSIIKAGLRRSAACDFDSGAQSCRCQYGRQEQRGRVLWRPSPVSQARDALSDSLAG